MRGLYEEKGTTGSQLVQLNLRIVVIGLKHLEDKGLGRLHSKFCPLISTFSSSTIAFEWANQIDL